MVYLRVGNFIIESFFACRRRRECINYNERYLHLFGDYIFYVNRGAVADFNAFAILRKTCKVWGKLYENAVRLNASYNSRNGLTYGKSVCVFAPCS